jgi:crossover junction endodeoxyribonuclease RuvC
MILIGIDPGIVNIGYCVFDTDVNKIISTGEITATQPDDSDKLVHIYREYQKLLAEHSPDTLIYEAPVFLGRGNNGERLNRAIGIFEVLSRLKSMSIYSYTPKHIKLVVTGTGKADKIAIAKSVNEYLGTTTKFTSSHSADATAIVITYIKNESINIDGITG